VVCVIIRFETYRYIYRLTILDFINNTTRKYKETTGSKAVVFVTRFCLLHIDTLLQINIEFPIKT